MDQQLMPARSVLPGRILARELEARGLTQKDLAMILGRPEQVVSEIVRGTKRITEETATELGAALGTSAEFWNALEANYRLQIAKREKHNDDIERRGRLYRLAPVAELVKRRWINGDESLDEIERQICAFLGIASLEETPRLAANFRRAQPREPETPAQLAWIKRVEHLARQQPVAAYSPARLRGALPRLLEWSVRAADCAHVPMVLHNLGVHFVIVPHLPKTYLDGAALHVEGRPTVALTLRYDRIDSFWFTLLHELAHIVLNHRGVYLDTLYGNGGGEENEREAAANHQAETWLIDREALAAFAHRAAPRYTREQIERFALQQRRHPGIVLGQLQHTGAVGWDHERSLLVKVKPYLKAWVDVATPRAA